MISIFFKKRDKRIAELKHALVMSESRERELKRQLSILLDPSTENSEEAFVIKYTWRISKSQDEMILSGSDSFSNKSLNYRKPE